MHPAAPPASRQVFWDQAEDRGAVVALEGGTNAARERLVKALMPPEALTITFPHNPQALGRAQRRHPTRRAAVQDQDAAAPQRRRSRPPPRTLLLTRTPTCAPDLVVSMDTWARRDGLFFVPEGCLSVRRPDTGQVWRISSTAPFDQDV